MHTHACVAALILVALPATGSLAQEAAPPEPAPKLTTRERMQRLQVRMKEEAQAIHRRDQAIKEELRALNDHEWAGMYNTGGGLSGLTLSLAPKAGFSFHHWSDIGDHDLNHGTVKEVKPDRIIFECVIDPKLNDARMFGALDGSYTPGPSCLYDLSQLPAGGAVPGVWAIRTTDS